MEEVQMASAERVKYRYLYARCFKAMSLEKAKEILGLPSFGLPSRTEVMKAWRSKAFEYHPDRGGDLNKMVEVNVAKDILIGDRPATPDVPSSRPESTPPSKPPAEVEKPLYNATNFEEAAQTASAPLSSVYWMWVTEFRMIRATDKEIMLGALGAGWVAYGLKKDNKDHVFMPVGAGVFHFGESDQQDTWWFGKPIVIPKMPTAKAIKKGLPAASRQIKGMVAVPNEVYSFGRMGSQYLSEKDFTEPKGSSETIKQWLDDTGYGKEAPFKMSVELVKGSRGEWDKQIDIVINGRRNRLDDRDREEFLQGIGKKLFKKNELFWWDSKRDILRLRNMKWALQEIWRYFRNDLAPDDKEALAAFMVQIGVQEPSWG